MELVPKIEFLMEGMNMSRKNKAQEETASSSEMENDSIWDKGTRDGSEEHENTEENAMPKLMSLSEKTKMEEQETESDSQEKNEKQLKAEAKLKREENKMFKELTKQDNKEWEFENVYPVYRNGKIHKWMTTLTSERINDLFKSGVIYYDYEIQRGYRKNIQGEKRPLITNRHVDDILKPMQSGKIAGGALTFCYFKEYEEELEYNEEENTLKVNNRLAVVDGGHRVFSCIKMVKLNKKDKSNPNPALFEYPVFLEFLSREEAMALFSEYANAGKKIGKNKAEALNVFDPSHDMAKEIIINSELHNKIETISSNPKENNIMLFSTLMNGIRIFKPQTQKDSDQIVEFLSKFWSELIYLFKDQMGNMEFKQRREIRKQTFLLEPMFLNGFFHVAKYLMDNPENWVEKLSKLKDDKIFFSRDNKLWLNILREGGKTIHTSLTQTFVIDEMVNKVK